MALERRVCTQSTHSCLSSSLNISARAQTPSLGRKTQFAWSDPFGIRFAEIAHNGDSFQAKPSQFLVLNSAIIEKTRSYVAKCLLPPSRNRHFANFCGPMAGTLGVPEAETSSLVIVKLECTGCLLPCGEDEEQKKLCCDGNFFRWKPVYSLRLNGGEYALALGNPHRLGDRCSR